MRTTGIFLLSLASASTLVAAKPAEVHTRNSLESLLDRFTHPKNGSTPAAPSASQAVEAPAVVKNESRVVTAAKKDLFKEDNGPTDKMVKRNRAKKDEENAKRWVWATSIIQDGSASAPPIGVNVNALTTPVVTVTTRAATLAPPSFSPVSSSSAATTSRSPAVAVVRQPYHKVHGARAAHAHGEKRWVWGTSVIQDNTPASEVPPVGQNANLLSGNTYTPTTPAATLVAPTFPAVASSSSQTPPASSSSAIPAASATTKAAVAVTTPSYAIAAVASSATPSSSAHHWDASGFFHNVEAGFEKLFHIHHHASASSAATAAPTVSTEVIEKRWIWATGIIQDDTPNAPPIGSNANMLNSAPANTPAATLVAPSFPPLTPAAFSSPSARAIAAVPASASAPPSAHTVPAVNRMPWNSVHDALLAASASSVAAARAAAQTPAVAAVLPPVSRLTLAQRIAAAEHGQARMAKVKRSEA